MGKDLNHCRAGCESFEKITLKPGWHQRPLICFPNILICHYLDRVDLIPDFFIFFWKICLCVYFMFSNSQFGLLQQVFIL